MRIAQTEALMKNPKSLTAHGRSLADAKSQGHIG